nr:8-hydroxygeraniol dehydrogenase-like [Ipomoea batatas]
MKYFGLDKPGLHIGVVGLGGLGHMALKYAKTFGCHVTVISTSASTLDGIIDTVAAVHPILPLLSLLKTNGKLVMVGAPEKPLELPIFPLLMGRKLVAGSLIGGIKETQEMLDFSAKHNVVPEVEVVPVDYANTAIERLAKADVKYRFVLDIGNTLKAALLKE